MNEIRRTLLQEKRDIFRPCGVPSTVQPSNLYFYNYYIFIYWSADSLVAGPCRAARGPEARALK
jgi:hypothetical protein